MFTISARGVYGLTAVYELALRYNQGPIQIREIAAPNEIPKHYLEQLLVTLKKAGIVESFRGSQGGYTLARRPEHISVLEVLSALEGKLETAGDAKRGGILREYWSTLERGIAELLAMSVADLMNETISAEQHFVYHI